MVWPSCGGSKQEYVGSRARDFQSDARHRATTDAARMVLSTAICTEATRLGWVLTSESGTFSPIHLDVVELAWVVAGRQLRVGRAKLERLRPPVSK